MMKLSVTNFKCFRIVELIELIGILFIEFSYRNI